MKRPLRTALLLVAAMCAQIAAQAGEMTLYSRDNLGGRQVTLRDVTPNLSDMGFNDRASSLVVRSGRWEVCADADFRGQCAVFERGEYPTLQQFSDQISSAREVGGPGRDRRGRNEQGQRGMMELFSQPGMHGNSTRMMRDTNDFNRIGFNDRASSIDIEDGNWQLCSDSEFRGTCRIFGPGRYPDLGPGLTGRVSSARLVQAPESGPRPGPGANGRPDVNAAVMLFADEGMRGRPLAVHGDTPDLVPLNFNDQALSIVVQAGTWQFCSDSFYRGQCRILGPGQHRQLEPALARSISSVRQVAAQAAAPAMGPGGEVEVFSAADFGGTRVPVRHDIRTLDEIGLNDRVGSIIVREGQWEFCVHANFGGQCEVYGPGRYGRIGPLTNEISSIRRVR